MKVEVIEIDNNSSTGYKDKIVQTITIEKQKIEDIFKYVYCLKRSLRYCYGSDYKFKDENLNKEYYKWKFENENIMMYYGGGVID